MRAVRSVVRKELLDNSRDRRAIASTLIYPLLGPLVVLLVVNVVAGSKKDAAHFTLAVQSAERAPVLMAFLKTHGVDIEAAPADHLARVRDGDLDLAVEIPAEFAERLGSVRPGVVRLLYDNSNNSARAKVRKVRRLLVGYASQVGALRLIARGVAPDVATPFVVQDIDVSTPERLAGQVLGMIPFFLVLATLMGGMNVAIDTTAGERERRSLEPLLVNPASTGALVVGKCVVTCVFSGLVTLLTVAGFAVTVRFMDLEALGFDITLGLAELAAMALVALPLVLFGAAFLMLISTFARSFKEAQTYLSLVVFLPAIPGIALTIEPVSATTWMMLVPMFAQEVLLSDLLRGEGIQPLHLVVAAASSAVFAAVCLVVTARLFRNERIVFGR